MKKMTDFQKTEQFPANSGKEYHFVLNTKLAWRVAVIPVCIFMLPILLTLQSFNIPFSRGIFILLMVVVPFFVGIPCILFYLRKNNLITINSKGISSRLFNLYFPKHIPWDSIVCIHRSSSGKPLFEHLVFTQKSGGNPLLITIEFGLPRFIGNGHSLTLIEAIEQFHSSVPELSEEARKTIPALMGMVDLGKEAGHVAYTAAGIAVLATILLMLPPRSIQLDVAGNLLHNGIYLIIAILSFAAACVYLWHTKEKRFIPLVALSLSAASTFLIYPLEQQTPAWFGEARKETFAIVHEDNKEQRWQGTSLPELSFSIYPKPERRIYHGKGTQQTLTIYQGHFGLSSMMKEQFQSLYKPEKRNDKKK
ncbi:MAG: hypothetical protein LBU53_11420 [Zoogloeaceae bacterium]|jgi:hypothetical protein|nr:hypothetical protein [Zoogloeaceae bacterium]